ncbi:hypothetical protein HYV73_04320 [Candidatus Uhrbacteria bacterium]|nr:hypothetical protein [Candidatus Uhrbacteria bacterium]
MIERREGMIPELGVQERLKAELLDGRLSAADFIASLMKLDQSTPSRDQAEGNVKVPTDPLVSEVLGRDEDVASDFNNLLSLSFFHIGQKKLF